jgi:hypothetical protein
MFNINLNKGKMVPVKSKYWRRSRLGGSGPGVTLIHEICTQPANKINLRLEIIKICISCSWKQYSQQFPSPIKFAGLKYYKSYKQVI